MITTAILEFFVVGALWLTLGVLTTFLYSEQSLSLLAAPAMKEVGWVWTLVGLPIVYLVGVLMQGVSWYCYAPVHARLLRRRTRPDLGTKYVKLYRLMEERRFKALELFSGPTRSGDEAAEARFEDHRDLGAFLDALRWELFHSERTELARQYLIQFHLWRICYGSIPPLLLFTVINIGIGVWGRAGSGVLFLTPLMVSGVLAGLCGVALVAAVHRNTRCWKYLRNGMASILGSEPANLKL